MLNLRKDYFNHSILPIFGDGEWGRGTRNPVKTRQCNML